MTYKTIPIIGQKSHQATEPNFIAAKRHSSDPVLMTTIAAENLTLLHFLKNRQLTFPEVESSAEYSPAATGMSASSLWNNCEATESRTRVRPSAAILITGPPCGAWPAPTVIAKLRLCKRYSKKKMAMLTWLNLAKYSTIMGLLTILKKMRQKEKEMRILILYT